MQYSFDVFDTVITRVVAQPEDIFYLTGKDAIKQGLWTKSIVEFKQERMTAEIESRNHREDSETTYTAIYECFQKRTHLSKEIVKEISELELSREKWSIRPVPEMIKRLVKARRKSKKGILFISDMYFPSNFIEEQLIALELFKSGDKVIVSCEHEASKHKGKLYSKIKADLNISGKWIHIGNHYQSDVINAKRNGIEPEFFDKGNLNKYEQILSNSGSIETSLFAGVSRIVRLNNKNTSIKGRTIFETTANVVAPCLISYTIWCLQKAKELDIKTLYFASRDGEVLLEIAKKIAVSLSCDIKLEYLHGSRKVWHGALLANLKEYPAGIFAFIFYKDPTLTDVLERFNITPHDIYSQLKHYGFSKYNFKRKITQKEQLIRVFQLQSVKEIISIKNNQHAKLALKYLENKGIFESGKKAIVDLGWGGNVLNSLNDFIAKNNGEKLIGFYWGIEGNNLEPYKYSYTNEKSSHYWQLEMFCCGSHGTVIGFKNLNNTISPQLTSKRNIPVIKWGLEYMRESILCYVNEVNVILSELFELKFEPFASLIDEFTTHPSMLEAKIWGDFPYEEDPMGRIINPIAPALSLRENLNLLISQVDYKKNGYEWPQARKLRYSWLFYKGLKIKRKIKNIFLSK